MTKIKERFGIGMKKKMIKKASISLALVGMMAIVIPVSTKAATSSGTYTK